MQKYIFFICNSIVAILTLSCMTSDKFTEILESSKECNDGDTCILVDMPCSSLHEVINQEYIDTYDEAMAKYRCKDNDNIDRRSDYIAPRCEAGKCVADYLDDVEKSISYSRECIQATDCTYVKTSCSNTQYIPVNKDRVDQFSQALEKLGCERVSSDVFCSYSSNLSCPDYHYCACE
jgi:hypothetical protein